MFLERVIVSDARAAMSFSLDRVIDVPSQVGDKIPKSAFREEEGLSTKFPFNVLMDNGVGELDLLPIAPVGLPIVKVSTNQVVNIPFHGEVRANGSRGMSNSWGFNSRDLGDALGDVAVE